MPLRDLVEWAQSLFAQRQPSLEPAAPAPEATVPAEGDGAPNPALIEAQRRLAVAEHRLRILEGSNRTAIRAFRRIAQEREQLVAARDAAEAGRAIAVGDRQRTMVLNDQLLAQLRESEEARLRLEEENRRLGRPMGSDPIEALAASAAPRHS